MYIAGKWYLLIFHNFLYYGLNPSSQPSSLADQKQKTDLDDSPRADAVSNASADSGESERTEESAEAPAADPVSALDVSFLQENVLAPILGITDPKTDSRIGFVGGIKGPAELKRRVDSGEMAAAFAMYPVSVEEIMAIADAGLVMPPKSTWFEPKLGSGLFVHKF